MVRSLANQAFNGNLMPHSQQGSGQTSVFLPRVTIGSVPRGRDAEQGRPQCLPDAGRLCREFPAPGTAPSSCSLLAAPGPFQQRPTSRQDEGLVPDGEEMGVYEDEGESIINEPPVYNTSPTLKDI